MLWVWLAYNCQALLRLITNSIMKKNAKKRINSPYPLGEANSENRRHYFCSTCVSISTLKQGLFSLIHSKKFCPMLHQKEALICCLQEFALSCTIFWCFYRNFLPFSGVTHHQFWYRLGRILVDSKSVLLFGAIQSKIF